MSNQAQGAQGPNPGRFFGVVNSYQNVGALKAAVELGFFTAVAEEHNTAAKLATRCKVAPRGARILADHLTVLGFLTKSGETYGLAEDAALFLNEHSPAYIGGCVEFLLAPELMENFWNLKERVRNGGAPAHGMLEPNHEVWVKFARGMGGLMMMPAQTLAREVLAGRKDAMKVLDISAGHGVWGIAFGQQNAAAQVVGLDWPNVLEVAKGNAAKFGVKERYTTIAGSAFEVGFGAGYDVVLVPNFLHHFDRAGCVTLLKKVHGALKVGGKAVVVEFAPDEGRVTPAASATFAIVMLSGTPGGDAYTVGELQGMVKEAGFGKASWWDLPNAMQRVVMGER